MKRKVQSARKGISTTRTLQRQVYCGGVHNCIAPRTNPPHLPLEKVLPFAGFCKEGYLPARSPALRGEGRGEIIRRCLLNYGLIRSHALGGSLL
jgi:hypothetical protein